MKKIKYKPLFIIEIYLIFSLFLFWLGPIRYNTHNTLYFIILILLYHVAFILGYRLGMESYSPCRKNIFYGDEKTIQKRYSLLIVVVFYVWIVYNRNCTHASSYIPVELFKNLSGGLKDAASAYSLTKNKDINQFQGNRLVTGTILPIYFMFYCFPALTVMYWKIINKNQKIWSVIAITLSFLTGISTGTNQFIFHVAFSLVGGIVLNNIVHRQNNTNDNNVKKGAKKLRKIIISLGVLLILYFINNIDNRLEHDPLNYFIHGHDIKLNSMYEPFLYNGSLFSLVSGLASIESYMCQGYYGMSLALDQPFTSTLGFGHSAFLAITFNNSFGFSIIDRTYQEKITYIWPRESNWHSFYSQMANDVGFIGVILIMFLLGIVISKVWRDIIENDNPFAKLLFIVMIPLFVFIPMNNQVGNMYGTFFSFWILLFLWGITRTKSLKIGRLWI